MEKGVNFSVWSSLFALDALCLPQFMRHDLMAHLFIALPAGAFGDQHLLVLINNLGNSRVALYAFGYFRV